MEHNLNSFTWPNPLWLVELDHMNKVTKFCNGNKSAACKILQVSRQTYYNRLRKYRANEARLKKILEVVL